MWEDIFPHLEEHYQCLFVDLPYHGNHIPYREVFTIQHFSEKLFEIIEPYRNNQPIAVVGFSIGAQIALELMAIRPHYFQFAMINSALCQPLRISHTTLAISIKLSMPLTKLKSFAKLQAKQLYIPTHLFDKYFAQSQAITSSQLIEIMHTNMSFSASEKLKKCQARTLITYGEREKKFMKDSALQLSRLLPNSEVSVLARLGHGFPFAEPKQFADAIRLRF